MNAINILLVEDENILASIIKDSLETRGFKVTIAANGVEGWNAFNNNRPDACVVDVMMPRKDGYSLVRDIRMVDQQIPIIFLTARNQIDEVLKGLEAGADDYMKKPFSMEELILRLSRMTGKRSTNSYIQQEKIKGPVKMGNFTFNPISEVLYYNDSEVKLAYREMELLNLLSQYGNTLVDRKFILIKLWGLDSPDNSRSMDVYITRLRKILQRDDSIKIVSVRTKGYKLVYPEV